MNTVYIEIERVRKSERPKRERESGKRVRDRKKSERLEKERESEKRPRERKKSKRAKKGEIDSE